MKICMLTTVHPPFDSRIFHKESKSLAKAGHTVTVVAPFGSKSNQKVDGINIVTVKQPESKVLHPLTMLRIFIEGLNQDCDVYHCHEPGSLFICSLLKVIRRKKLIYDAHEHYPSLIAENSVFPDFLRPLVFLICDRGEKVLANILTDYVITVDEVLKEKFKKINRNVCVISNYPKIELFEIHSSTVEASSNDVIYVGGLTKIRGTLETIMAFEKVLEKIPGAKMTFVGGFIHPEYEKKVMDYYHSHNLEENVTFTGHVSHGKVGEYMKNASVAIGLLQPNPRYELAIPVKLFEYMASGKAVVMSNFKYNSKLISEIKCGLSVDPNNIQEIADTIIWLLEHPEDAKNMGKNGRRAVEAEYNWENMEKRLLSLYDNLS